MATLYDDTHPIEISDDDARSGVTGHNVRYVLALGLTGVIAAFAAIAIYFGFDALRERATAALSHNASDVLRALALYAAIALAGAGVGVLAFKAWALVSGDSDDASQTLMRLRVVTQLALVCVIMAMLYVTMG